jgi:putative inorganic carbon (hco3(-)) transporter
MGEHEKHISNRQVSFIAIFIVTAFLLNYSMQFITIVDQESLKSIINGIMLVGSVAVVFLAAASFELSLVVFIFVAPLTIYNVPGLDFFFTYGDAYLIVLVFIWISRLAFGRERPLTKTFLDRLIFLFILLSLLASIKSRGSAGAVKELVQTLEYLVFCYYLFSMAVNRRNVLDGVVYAIVICGGLIAAYGIFQYVKMGGGEVRTTGTFGHFNAMGTFMAMMTTFLFNLVITEEGRWKKYLYYGILFLDIVALMMTFSRGAWIGTIVAVIISAQIRGMVQFIRIFALVVVVFLVIALVAPSRYMGRIASVPRVEDTSSKTRLVEWKIASETISAFPLLGVGIDNNAYWVTEKYNEYSYGEIHNLFLHIGSERGAPAMFILIGIFVYFFIHIYRRIGGTEDKYFFSLYLALFTAVLSFGIVNIFAYQLIRGLGLFFAIFLGLYNAAMYIEKNEPAESKWAEMLSTLESKRPLSRMGL